ETIAANLLRRKCLEAGRPAYHLKVAQKLWIRQAIQDGFAPHAVARWANHTLSMQERAYCEEDVYLPGDQSRDYAEFGELTEFGHQTKAHVSTLSRDLGIQ